MAFTDKARQFLAKFKEVMDTSLAAQIAELERTAQKRPLTDGEAQMLANMTSLRDGGSPFGNDKPLDYAEAWNKPTN